jgi:hypothetical protein
MVSGCEYAREVRRMIEEYIFPRLFCLYSLNEVELRLLRTKAAVKSQDIPGHAPVVQGVDR